MTRVLGICGSLRSGSYNRALLEAARELVPDGMTVEIFGRTGEIPLYDADLENDERRPEPVRELKREIAEADGVLISSPEYNHGISGVLKNAIDWASRPGHKSPFVGKPVAIMGVSPGAGGTAHAQIQLREALYSTLAHVMPHPGVLVGTAKEKFTDGELTDERTRDFVAKFLAQFAEYVERLSEEPAPA
ncbi:NADPH-dependent FMN reductase [soil metagenome]